MQVWSAGGGEKPAPPIRKKSHGYDQGRRLGYGDRQDGVPTPRATSSKLDYVVYKWDAKGNYTEINPEGLVMPLKF